MATCGQAYAILPEKKYDVALYPDPERAGATDEMSKYTEQEYQQLLKERARLQEQNRKALNEARKKERQVNVFTFFLLLLTGFIYFF